MNSQTVQMAAHPNVVSLKSMKENPFWQAGSRSAGQEVTFLYGNRPTQIPNLRHLNPTQNITHTSSKFNFNICPKYD
jgi:hypothetical protein